MSKGSLKITTSRLPLGQIHKRPQAEREIGVSLCIHQTKDPVILSQNTCLETNSSFQKTLSLVALLQPSRTSFRIQISSQLAGATTVRTTKRNPRVTRTEEGHLETTERSYKDMFSAAKWLTASGNKGTRIQLVKLSSLRLLIHEKISSGCFQRRTKQAKTEFCQIIQTIYPAQRSQTTT